MINVQTGKKQYIFGVCAGHAYLSDIQIDVEQSNPIPRIRILFNWSDK